MLALINNTINLHFPYIEHIVDISDEAILSVVELLADYYDCYFEIQGHKDNDISWWLFEDVEKVITITEGKKEKEINVKDIKNFWKYLEDNRNKKLPPKS